jgi:hypothetical protein
MTRLASTPQTAEKSLPPNDNLEEVIIFIIRIISSKKHEIYFPGKMIQVDFFGNIWSAGGYIYSNQTKSPA